AEARDHLMPVIRSSTLFAATNASNKAKIVWRPITDATGVGLAIDRPTGIAYVTEDQLASMKLGVDQARDLALANLARRSTHELAQIAPGVWSAAEKDNYDSSRLLLVDKIRKLPVAPPIVAAVPNRETLLVTSGKDAKALLAMADLVEKAAGDPRSIHAIALCLDGNTW